jgi:membrane protein
VVIAFGFLLVVSLIISAWISGVEKLFAIPANSNGIFSAQAVNLAASFVVFTLLFGLMFKLLPDAQIAWRHVALGAPITSLLFTAGKYVIGIYLGWSSTASAFGAASSVVVILIWVYYSSQILLFGAEFTRVYAERSGAEIVPKASAEKIP